MATAKKKQQRKMKTLNQTNESRVDIDRRLERIEELNGQIRLFLGLRAREQSRLLADAKSSKCAYDRAVIVLGLIKNGAPVIWGEAGYEIHNSGVRVPCSLMNDLYRLGLVKSNNGIVVSAEEFESPPVNHERVGLESLLCDEWTRSLDNISNVMWRRDQFVGSCTHIFELQKVYVRTINGEPRGYLRRIGDRASWERAITSLYFAAFLNLFGVATEYRKGLVQRSVATIEQLVPGALD